MKKVASTPRRGTSEMEGYYKLGVAVIQQALLDLPIKHRWEKKSASYQLVKQGPRDRAIHFFESGNYLFWVDVYDGDREKTYKAYQLQVQKTIYLRKREVREEIGGNTG